jgi:AcrR family transcriptional regulator
MNPKLPSKSPISRRARSARSHANAAKVLKAITRNAIERGIDELNVSEVAKLSGLTTGAIYGRFEDQDEMAIELWQSVVKDNFYSRLQRGVRLLCDNPTQMQQSADVKEFESPDEIAKLGAEFLVISRRNQAIGEVVIPEVTKWFAEFGLKKSNKPIDNAAIAIAISASIGTALRSLVMKTNPNWLAIAIGLQGAIANASPSAQKIESPKIDWVDPETDNPIRTAFCVAVAEVVAKSGYANATISRIVRRAGLTNGSLYNLYPDKEALTDDAMQIFLNLSSNVNRESNRRATLNLRADRGLADSFALGLMPSRRMWLDFRLECLVASRNHLPTRKKFRQSLERSREDLGTTMPDLPAEIIDLLAVGEQAIGIGFTVLEPYTSVLNDCDFFSIMATMVKLQKLF